MTKLVRLALSVLVTTSLATAGCAAAQEEDEPVAESSAEIVGCQGGLWTVRTVAQTRMLTTPWGTAKLWIPAGAQVILNNSCPNNGYYFVSYLGVNGWVWGDHLDYIRSGGVTIR